jgi:glycosyltransferase involved in cell wall biosynthesis
MVARVAPAKDHATLARAAKEVVANFPNAHFLIIGDHAESSLNQRHFVEITELLRSLGIAEKFTFAGHRDDVVRLLSALDISVLSTHTEGLPLVLLEAMALGKPVLATAVGGVPEVIVNGKTGLLHDHEDAASLAQHMMSLLSNEELAHQLGEAGREHVRSNFSSQSFKSNVTNLYREMLEDRQR